MAKKLALAVYLLLPHWLTGNCVYYTF